jgi:hypothetical protein
LVFGIQHNDKKYFGSILTPNMLKKEISESILYEATQINLILKFGYIDKLIRID